MPQRLFFTHFVLIKPIVRLHCVAGDFSWFLSISFVFFSIMRSIPFILVLLLRLRAMADPEKLDVKTVVGRETIIGAGVWIVATLMFVYNYFSHFSPSYLRFFSYPEG